MWAGKMRRKSFSPADVSTTIWLRPSCGHSVRRTSSRASSRSITPVSVPFVISVRSPKSLKLKPRVLPRVAMMSNWAEVSPVARMCASEKDSKAW